MKSDDPRERAFIAELHTRQESREGMEPLSWLSDFVLTDKEVAELEAAEILIPGLFISGHICVIAAEPNAGKSALMLHFAPQLVEMGMRVIYVNADVGAGDAKALIELARMGGYTLLLPDLKGMSMEDVVKRLKQSVKNGEGLHGQLFIFDTLKKMVHLMSKGDARALFILLRQVTALGATVVLLGHTNKFSDAEGNPILEGVGDVRSDTDELIYLIPSEGEDGNRIISTDATSMRAKKRVMSDDWRDRTFVIDKQTRAVTEIGYVDTRELREAQKQRAEDSDTIGLIRAYIRENDRCKQADIIAHVKDVAGTQQRTTVRILKRYKDTDWHIRKGFEANRFEYSVKAF